MNLHRAAVTVIIDDSLRAVEGFRSNSQARFQIRQARVRSQRGPRNERLPHQRNTQDGRLR